MNLRDPSDEDLLSAIYELTAQQVLDGKSNEQITLWLRDKGLDGEAALMVVDKVHEMKAATECSRASVDIRKGGTLMVVSLFYICVKYMLTTVVSLVPQKLAILVYPPSPVFVLGFVLFVWGLSNWQRTRPPLQNSNPQSSPL